MKTYEKIYLSLKAASDFISGEDLAHQLKLSRTSIWKGIQQLEKQGLMIQSVRHLGYKLISGDLYLPQQLAHDLEMPVFFHPHSHSTQLDAKTGIEQQDPAPALYLAPTQLHAKGRFGRAFFAAKTGGIYMSLRISPNLPFSDMKPYTLLMAASIVKAIEEKTNQHPVIKWVNDIYLEGKKIGGILTEAISSVETQTVTDMIIGVGLNFSVTDFPDNLSQTATSLFQTAPTLTRQDLLTAIWDHFFHTPEAELLALYKEKSLVLGKQVSFVQNQENYQGLAQAITDTGELVVQLEDGSQKVLSSGEISLTSWN